MTGTTNTEIDDREKTLVGGPGGKPLGPTGIILLSIYLLTFTAFLGYSMVRFWVATPSTTIQKAAPSNQVSGAQPSPEAPAAESVPQGNTVTISYFSFKPFQLSYEVTLLILVAICGGLGAMVHCLRSLSWYIGNRELRRSWVAKYVIQPFVGASLALIFFFVARAGFFSVQATAESTNQLGFAAVAGLVGLFSDQAVLKLKEVAEILFTKPKPGADAAPQENNNNSNNSGDAR